MHVREVRIDAGDRIPLLLEATELRMVAIPSRPPQQDRPSEKRLAPESDQPHRIQVARVDRPEPHGL